MQVYPFFGLTVVCDDSFRKLVPNDKPSDAPMLGQARLAYIDQVVQSKSYLMLLEVHSIRVSFRKCAARTHKLV